MPGHLPAKWSRMGEGDLNVYCYVGGRVVVAVDLEGRDLSGCQSNPTQSDLVRFLNERDNELLVRNIVMSIPLEMYFDQKFVAQALTTAKFGLSSTTDSETAFEGPTILIGAADATNLIRFAAFAGGLPDDATRQQTGSVGLLMHEFAHLALKGPEFREAFRTAAKVSYEPCKKALSDRGLPTDDETVARLIAESAAEYVGQRMAQHLMTRLNLEGILEGLAGGADPAWAMEKLQEATRKHNQAMASFHGGYVEVDGK